MAAELIEIEIDNVKRMVFEDSIKKYCIVGPDLFYKTPEGKFLPAEGKLIVDEEGNIIDCENCLIPVEQILYEESGMEFKMDPNFFMMDNIRGVIIENKIHFLEG